MLPDPIRAGPHNIVTPKLIRVSCLILYRERNRVDVRNLTSEV